MGIFGNLLGGSDADRFAKKLEEHSRKVVGDEMSRDVMTISPEDSLIDAANIMIGQHISCLVVVGKDSDEPLGIITERDFFHHPPEKKEELTGKNVEDMMTKNPVTIQEELSILEAAKIMDKHKFRKLIVTEDGSLSGILTQTDLVRWMDEFYQDFAFRTSDSLTVKEVMKEALKFNVDDTIGDVHKKMVKDNVGSMFVMEDDELKGAFTEFDFLSQLALNPEKMFEMEMGDVMSYPLVGINSSVDLFDANHLMLEKDMRRLPVFENEKLVGKVTQTTIRKGGFEIIEKCLKRIQNEELEKVSFERLKDQKPLVRKVRKSIQEFRYPEKFA